MKQVSVGDADNVWGVNSSNEVFRHVVSSDSWEQVTGQELAQVSVGSDGTVWGVDSKSVIYRRLGNNTWKPIEGRMTQVALGDSAHIWGLEDGNVYKRWVLATP